MEIIPVAPRAGDREGLLAPVAEPARRGDPLLSCVAPRWVLIPAREFGDGAAGQSKVKQGIEQGRREV